MPCQQRRRPKKVTGDPPAARHQTSATRLIALLGLLTAGCRQPSPEALYREAETAHRQGDLNRALQAAERGFKRTPSSWPLRLLTAEILFDAGVSGRALELARKEPPPRSSELQARRAVLLARCRFRAAGARAESLNLLEKAEPAATPALRVRIELTRGVMSATPQEAERYVDRALAEAEAIRDPFLVTSALCDRGYYRYRSSRFDEGAYWLEKARQAAEQNGFQLLLERTLGNLGWCYYNLGEVPQALELLSRAESLADRIGDGDFRYRWLNNIGNVYLRRRAYAQAIGNYQEAERLAAVVGNNRSRAIALNNLAEAALDAGDVASADRYNQQALEIKRQLGDLRSLAHSEWNSARILEAQGRVPEAMSAFTQVAESAHAAGEPVVVWKAHADLAALYRSAGQAPAADREYRAALDTIDQEWEQISRDQFKVTFLAPLIRFYQDYVDFLVDRGEPERALEAAAAARARVLTENLHSMPGKVADFIALARKSGSVFLCYWLAPRRSFLWAVTGRGSSIFTLPPSAEIDRIAAEYTDAVQERYDPLENDNPAGQRLTRILLEPVRKLIPPGSHVVLVPDGRLHELNFETLVVDGHYWIEDVRLAVTPSLSVLSTAKARPPESLLVIGDPDRADPHYPPLSHVKQEISAIQRGFPNRAVYTGAQATPGTFAAASPGRFSLIHFAAHATANADSPLDSAVILSRQGDSYKLYAKDVLRVPLDAELVTLSACHSAGAKAYSGEGLVGFAWAFLQSGAHNVIAGQWDVDDAAAMALMTRLYQGLAAGIPPSAALRQAKLDLLRDPEFRAPYYWAPFQLFTRSLE